MGDLENVNEGIGRMVSALEKMTLIMSVMAEEQKQQGQRLAELEKQVELVRQYSLAGIPYEKLRHMVPREFRGE